jgi:phenylpropionate dioxygenase-like ring-hydroxylating dioxygenase large terminal subunit
VTVQTPAAMSLPARYYTDPDYFRAELEWLFLNSWFHAGRAEEIPASGQFVVREIAGESLILFRDDRGAVRAFHNVCRHRGTQLVSECSGRFSATIQCPYHAWTYNLGGCLVAAPHMEGTDGFRLEDYPLAPVATGLWDGHVFLNIAENPASLASQLDGLDARFAPWGMEQLRSAKRVVYDVAANWKLIIHNYSECLHCPGVHPALQKLSHYLSGENEPASPSYLGGRMRLREGIGTFSYDGLLRHGCLPDLEGDDRRCVYFYAVLPNLLLSLHPDYVMVHTLWPRSADRTEMTCEWLFHPEAMARADFDPVDVTEFWDLTNRQDWHVCEQMQKGLRSRAYRPGPYSHREELLHGFDRLIVESERRAGYPRSSN